MSKKNQKKWKTIPREKRRMVWVQWEDAYATLAAKHPDEMDCSGVLVETVGILLKENSKGIAIASDSSGTPDVMRGITVIPKAYIVTRKDFWLDVQPKGYQS